MSDETRRLSLPTRDQCLHGPRGDYDAEKVASYLDAGELMIGSPGVIFDPCEHGSKTVAGAMHLMTDGVWSWQQALSYFVRKYRIVLPEEFVRVSAEAP